MPDFQQLRQVAEQLHQLNAAGKLLALHHIGQPGLAAALAIMAFGNGIGFADGWTGVPSVSEDGRNACLDLFIPRYFAFLVEHIEALPPALSAQPIGHTTTAQTLVLSNETNLLADLQAAWTATLEPVYPTQPEMAKTMDRESLMVDRGLQSALEQSTNPNRQSSISRPRVVIPAFPGTNSEYDSAKAFREAGAEADILVFRNLSTAHIDESLRALAAQIRRSQILMFPGGFSAGDEPDGSAKFIATVIRSPRVADAIMDLLLNRDGLILGICNGFQALIKTGLVPFGRIMDSGSLIENGGSLIIEPPNHRTTEPPANAPTLVHNDIGRHISCYVNTRIVSTLSPWLSNTRVGDLHTVPMSHGEGKFHASAAMISQLAAAGQIATQYCDANGLPSMDISINPNGSLAAIEGITSPCGRVFGKMAHSERAATQVAKNIPGNKHQPIFAAGVAYF